MGELEMAKSDVVQWRLGLNHATGISTDRCLSAVIMTIDELRYYDAFPVLLPVFTAFKSYEWNIQHARNAPERARLPARSYEEQQSH